MELLFAGWFALAASWSGTKHAVMPVLAFVFVNVVVLVVPTR